MTLLRRSITAVVCALALYTPAQAQSIKPTDLFGKWVLQDGAGDTLVMLSDSTYYWILLYINGAGNQMLAWSEVNMDPKLRWDILKGDTIASTDGACITGTKTCTGDRKCYDGTPTGSGWAGGDCKRADPGYKITLNGDKLTFTPLSKNSSMFDVRAPYRRAAVKSTP